MPNHFHGILIIHDDVGASRRLAPTTTNAISPKPGSLGAIMAQFKSIVTKRIWKMPEFAGTPIWQRNYGACPELVEGNTSSAASMKWAKSGVTSRPIR
jgi:hypothetical protein